MPDMKREPPSPEQVVARARCCMVLGLRDMAENADRELGAPPEFMARQIDSFVESFDLADEFTAVERRLLDAPYGTIGGMDQARLIAASEALRTLLWALGAIEDFSSVTPSPEERWRDLQAANALSDEEVAQRGLRPVAEISRAHLTCELWLWRIRVATAERSGRIGEAERRARLERPLDQAVALGLGIETADGDIALDGRAFSTLAHGDCNQIYRVTLARCATLAWLLGPFENWDQAYVYSHEMECRAELEPPEMPEPAPSAGPHWPLPGEQKVAHRALALTALLFREQFEDPDRRQGATHLLGAFEAWLRHPVLAAALSPREAELMRRPHGRWTRREAVDAQWRTVALGCLLWAISRIDEVPA